MNSSLVLIVILTCMSFGIGNSNICTKDSCFPPNWDLETVKGATIIANSTCGLNGNEDYCVNGNCYQCNNAIPSTYRGVNLTIDSGANADNSYWKSENLVENVVLELNLGHAYFFVAITATFAYSSPAAMYFSKSADDGSTWQILAYFSTDCKTYFNMSATEEKNRNGFNVQCFDLADTQLKVSYQPWRDSQFAASIRRNYSLQREFLATSFRMVLVKFQVPRLFDRQRADGRNYFFAVKDWQIRGSCFCNGQSAECDTEERWKCNCLKNTTGDNCGKCLSLYNQEKYEPGKACTACECNNHSSMCEYDEEKGQGVCKNCSDYTTGDSCEQCLPYFYEKLLPVVHPDRCQACNCNSFGITGEPGSDVCDQTTGQCDCRANVTGRRCDRCKDEFWNLSGDNPSGCQKCLCQRAGTVNGSVVCDQVTGQCPCREHLVGIECTKCEDGYYNLTFSNVIPCKDCSCSRVGSVNLTCDQTNGLCNCRNKFSGSKCNVLEANSYIPGVIETTFEAEQFLPNLQYFNQTSSKAGVLLDGEQYSRSLIFQVFIPKTSVYSLVIRYQTAIDWKDVKLRVESLLSPHSPFSCEDGILIRNHSLVHTATLFSHLNAMHFGDACLVNGPYAITLELPSLPRSHSVSRSSSSVLIDSLVVLPSVLNFTYPKADNNTLFYYKKAFAFDTWSRAKDDVQRSLAPYFTAIYNGGRSCSCNETGSYNSNTCNKDGGQCNCRPNIVGLNCDRCAPSFYNFSKSGCQRCNCDLIGSNSTLCDTLTGKCQCKSGVVGRQCSHCETNYFGFHRGNGCSPCSCDRLYSTNLQCDNRGVCPCLPGVKLPKCEACNDTAYNLTLNGCENCHCDVDGSVSLSCDKTSGECSCKSFVIGRTCNSCTSAMFYGLDKHHPTGCLKCQCSGKTNNCTTKKNTFETSILTKLSVSDPADITGLQNWTTTFGPSQAAVFDFVNDSFTGVIEVASSTAEIVYFRAPMKFLGDKRRAYQHRLSFYLKVEDNMNRPLDTTQGDVILKGKWFDGVLVHRFDKRPSDKFTEFSVFLEEGEWKVNNTDGKNISSYEMVLVLSHLEELWIRAKWSNTTGATTSIAIINMRLSEVYKDPSQAPYLARMTKSVELCDCPGEFAGDSCERCADGYTRLVPGSGPYTECVPCSCNGNSDKCDPISGVCIDCQYNTTGDHCERCALGYYGNATSGSRTACLPCTCYGGHVSCDLVSDGSFACHCGLGFEGNQCETCADGFFGVPTEVDGVCTPCECNGNALTCNRTTGDCSSNCENNSTGSNCEFCKDEFFGDATRQNCRECLCSPSGSINNTCDRFTGECHCLDNIVNRNCSECKFGAWDYGNATGCKECDCFEDGSLSLQCNLTTGICPCKVNVTGTQCDRCIDGRYGVSIGCVECDCNMTYSNHSICDPRNGQCQCKQSSAGGFYGGRRCTQCRWDAVGTFPVCIECNETCYRNWYELIDTERVKVNELQRNVTNILKAFNGSSVADINRTLNELNEKLTYSERIFKGAFFNTKTKQEQYRVINNTLLEIKQKLDNVNESLLMIQYQLLTAIQPFDGTVNVSRMPPPVQANFTTLRKWAEQILLHIEDKNKTAHKDYDNISSLYDEIQAYNSRGLDAIGAVGQSTRRLDNITMALSEVNSIFRPEFHDNVKKNENLLEHLKKNSTEINRLVNESALKSHDASDMLDHAQSNISEARRIADRNWEKSQLVYNESVEMEKKAHEARNASDEFKTNSSILLTQVDNSIADVKASLDDMAHARDNVDNVTIIAREVLGMTIPVTEQHINDISERILDIEVDPELVSETLKNASAGLKIATEAQKLAEKAMNVSFATLRQVNEIERKIEEAHKLREEARTLQNSTDKMVAEIMQITDEVEKESLQASAVGNASLTLLKRTIQDIDESLKCFNESKELALNASRVANMTYGLIINVSQIHNESKATLLDMETTLNVSYHKALSSYRNISETFDNANKLFEEVKEAEDLLKSYVDQRDEMATLQSQVDTLEKELDSLNKDFDEKLGEYNSCRNEG